MTGGWGISPEEQPEFNDIFAVALTLGIRNRKKKAEKVAKILDWGTKAIKPLLDTVECHIADSSSTEDQIDRRADLVSDVIVQIGPKAIPTLIEIAHNDIYEYDLRRLLNLKVLSD